MPLIDNSQRAITDKSVKDHIRKVLVPKLVSWWEWADQTDPSIITDGLRWYDSARQFVHRLSRSYLLPYRHVAGAVAIMSQQTRWSTQVRYTNRWLYDVLNGDSPTKTSATLYAKCAHKAADFVNTGDESLIGGDKIRNFYNNLCGRIDNVTVDTWAIRAALTRPAGNPEKVYKAVTETRVQQYFREDSIKRRSVEAAYKSAAAKKGVTPSDFQAVVWVAVRKFHGN